MEKAPVPNEASYEKRKGRPCNDLRRNASGKTKPVERQTNPANKSTITKQTPWERSQLLSRKTVTANGLYRNKPDSNPIAGVLAWPSMVAARRNSPRGDVTLAKKKIEANPFRGVFLDVRPPC